jgi:8-oxo-dGTP pyrophosphatase MutT (NUDIX family)
MAARREELSLRERLIEALRDTRAPDDPIGEARYGAHGDLPADFQAPLDPRPAAVLVPVVDRPEPGLLLTVRTDHLPDHPGQISFPGGSVESGDADAVATALRETREETGIPEDKVQPIGFLQPYLTITGYAVTPVVGLLAPDYRLAPDPHEVAEVFELPLRHALDPANRRLETHMFQGRELHYYVIDWQDHRVWGATAAMIVSFERIIKNAV